MEEDTKVRMYRDCADFIAKQRVMIEEEHTAEKAEHDLIVGQSTCTELEELGLAINKLKLKSIKTGLFSRTLATFAHAHYSSKALESPEMAKMLKLPESKFSCGDNVALYRQALTFTASPLEKGVIFKKNDYKFVVAFDGDINENALSNEVISIVMEVNEVTHNRYLKCLDMLSVKSADPNFKGAQLLHVLLDGSDPTNVNSHLKQAQLVKKPIERFYKKDLNEEQKDAINFALGAQTLGLIHGPPGTGKTMTVCELIYQAVQMGMRVLACAGSNIAVDNIVERLAKTDLNVMRIGHPARMLPSVYDQCLDNKLRKTTCFKELKTLKQNINKQLLRLQKETSYGEKKEIKKLLTELRKEMREQEQLSIKEVIQEIQVVCCTNSGAADSIFRKSFGSIEFDLVVIDECAQALELSCWIPILQGKRVVLAGDHKQLPPTIKSRNEGLSVTLFDRVLKEFKEEDVSRLLKVQYRMNQEIMEWSSQNVYGGQLRAHESVAHHSIGAGDNILLFIDTAGAKMGESVSEGRSDRKTKSKSNLGEADLIRIIYNELLIQGVQSQDIGVITPYNAQVDMIKKMFQAITDNATTSSAGGSTNLVEVSTVDGFQGREKECILISTVRSNPLKHVGFLSDYRRMNVAVTRARKFVCLVGDSETISSDAFLGQMVAYFQEHGEVRSASEYLGMDDVHFNYGMTDDKAKKELLKSEGIISGSQISDGQKKSKKEQKKGDKNQGKTDKDKNIKTTTTAATSNIFSDQIKKSQFSEETLKQQYTEDISELLLGKKKELKYEQLNSFQRHVLHELAEKFDIEHVSIGTDALKDMVLKKKEKAKAEIKPNVTSSDQTKTVVINEGSEEEDEDTIVKEGPVSSKNAKKKAKKNKNKGGILIGSSVEENKKTEQKVVSQQKEIFEEKKSSDEKQELKEVPAVLTNESTQYGEYARKKQAEAAEKERQLKEQAEKAQQEKKLKQQQKKKGAKPEQKDKEESEEDILALLAGMSEAHKYCAFQQTEGSKKCGVYVEKLGSDCKFCGRRFCIRHGLPENHGCGELVKKEAKEQFVKQFTMQHRGEKALTKDQLLSLQSRLQDKIKQDIDGRKAKQPEKKNEKK